MPLIKVAEIKSKQGLQAIAYMQKRLSEEQEKLVQLRACKEDYDSGSSVDVQSINAGFLKSYRAFSQSLETALQQQSQQVEIVEAQLQEVQGMWRKLDGRCRTLQKTQDKFATQERLFESKLEQKNLDEFVSQAAARSAIGRSH